MRTWLFILMLLPVYAMAGSPTVITTDDSNALRKLPEGQYIQVLKPLNVRLVIQPGQNVTAHFGKNKVAQLFLTSNAGALQTVKVPMTIAEKSCVSAGSTGGLVPEAVGARAKCDISLSFLNMQYMWKWVKHPDAKRIGKKLEVMGEAIFSGNPMQYGFGLGKSTLANSNDPALAALKARTGMSIKCDKGYLDGFHKINEWTTEETISNEFRKRQENRSDASCLGIAVIQAGPSTYNLKPALQKNCDLFGLDLGLSLSSQTRQCEIWGKIDETSFVEIFEKIQEDTSLKVVPARFNSEEEFINNVEADAFFDFSFFKDSPYYALIRAGLVTTDSQSNPTSGVEIRNIVDQEIL